MFCVVSSMFGGIGMMFCMNVGKLFQINKKGQNTIEKLNLRNNLTI